MKRMFLLLGVLARFVRSAVPVEGCARMLSRTLARQRQKRQRQRRRRIKQPRTRSRLPRQLCLATAPSDADMRPAAPQLELGYTGDTAPDAAQKLANKLNRPGDWNQWGGSPLRNNVVNAKVPTEWDDRRVRRRYRRMDQGRQQEHQVGGALGLANIRQRGRGARQSFRRHQQRGRISKALPGRHRSGRFDCVLTRAMAAFFGKTTARSCTPGRVHDWPLMGICSSPLVEGDRVYYVTSRGEVKCLDTEGFIDGDNDGPAQAGEVHREGRGRRDLGARYDERPGGLAAQHGELLDHFVGRLLVRAHQQRRGRCAHQPAVAERAELYRGR